MQVLLRYAGFRSAAVLIFALTISLSGCRTGSESQRSENILSVSIQPLAWFAERLGGEHLSINVMIPPGASHGSYSPTPQQFRQLSDSRLYLRISHLGYERTFLHRLGELNPDMSVLDLAAHVELIRGEEIDHGDHVHEGGIDPHIWMSPAVMQQLLPVMATAMSQAYPELASAIEDAYPALEAEIMELHTLFESLSGTLSERRFLIFHPALTYLARDYGFEQVAIEYGGKEPSPAQLKRIIQEARAETIPVIFIQAEYDKRNAELVSQETGAHLVQIDPLAHDWAEGMRELAGIFETWMQ